MSPSENDRIAALEAEIARLREKLAQSDRDAAATVYERAVDDRRHARDLAAGVEANAALRAVNADLIESSAFLRGVLAASDDCIKVLDLDGRLIFMSEGGRRVMEVDDFEPLRNCPWPDFWSGEGGRLAREAVATARSGGVARFQGPAKTAKGTPRHWDVFVTAIPDDEGKPQHILSISRDITDMRVAGEALSSSETMLRSVTDAMPALIGYIDRDHRFRFANRAYERLLKRPRRQIVGRTVEEVFGDDRFAGQIHLLDRALAGEQVREQVKAERPNGRVRWTDTRVIPHRDAAGEVIGAYALVIDVTELKQGEAQRQLLTRELAHRVKNTLATVAAIANQTLRPPASFEEAAQAFSARLSALGAAHDLLTQANWKGAPLRSVVEDALAPYGAGQGRFSISGPAVDLDAKRALSLALAIHELATNAAKYGALSTDAGRVAISWTLDEAGGERRFRFQWREEGGPPVTAPTRRGFGSRLIERSLAAEWDGEARLGYEPSGLVFEFTAPMA